VSRLRLERAAFELLVRDATLVDIALDCGFGDHETFTRAFRRHFGVPPSAYRTAIRQRVRQRPAPRPVDLPPADYQLSATRATRLRTLHLACKRHVGPYELVPNSLFDTLDAWATRQRRPLPRIWLGIGHDAPGITSSEKLRFDAALVVSEPFRTGGGVSYQVLHAADYALTTHVGPYDSLPAAYGEIFARALMLKGYELVGLPVVEIYHTTRVDTARVLNHTDIYLPIRRKAR
jgi:AraC family transcriptional regulator